MIVRRMIVMIGVALLLSGCWIQQTNTTIDADGSGINEINIGFSKQFLSFAGLSGGGSGNDLQDALDQLNDVANTLPAEWNASSSPWESADGQYKGTTLRMEFSDLAMLQEQLSRDMLGAGNSIIQFSDVNVQRDGGEVLVQATLTSPLSSDQLPTESTDLLSGLDQLEGLGVDPPVAVWKITMPGKISAWTEHDAGVLSEDGQSVTYTIPFPPAQVYNISVRASTGNALLKQGLAVVLGLVGLGMLLIGAGMWLNRRNRQPRPAQPVPPVTPPGWHQPTPDTGPLPMYPPPASAAPPAPDRSTASAPLPSAASETLPDEPYYKRPATQPLRPPSQPLDHE